MTFCYSTAGIGASFRTYGQTDGQTDRYGSQNIYLDKNAGSNSTFQERISLYSSHYIIILLGMIN